MGKEISKFLGIDDQAQEQKEVKAQMRLLQTMGTGMVNKFYQNVRLDNDPEKFKIGKIMTSASNISIMATVNSDGLKKAANDVIDGLEKGEIASVLKTVVGTAIDALFASTTGAISEKSVYSVKLNGIGLERIDIYLYHYDFSSCGMLQGHEQNLMVYAYTVSTVGGPITGQDLKDFVSLSVSDKDEDGKPLTEEELILKQLKIFKMLEGEKMTDSSGI